jgi:hypothetical protein
MGDLPGLRGHAVRAGRRVACPHVPARQTFRSRPDGETALIDAAITTAYRALGLLGAVLAGIGLWRFTSGDWQGGILCVVAVVAVAVAYVLGQRRARGISGGRRY